MPRGGNRHIPVIDTRIEMGGIRDTLIPQKFVTSGFAVTPRQAPPLEVVAISCTSKDPVEVQMLPPPVGAANGDETSDRSEGPAKSAGTGPLHTFSATGICTGAA